MVISSRYIIFRIMCHCQLVIVNYIFYFYIFFLYIFFMYLSINIEL